MRGHSDVANVVYEYIPRGNYPKVPCAAFVTLLLGAPIRNGVTYPAHYILVRVLVSFHVVFLSSPMDLVDSAGCESLATNTSVALAESVLPFRIRFVVVT